MDINDYKEQNILLQKKIIKLERELDELRETTGKAVFKKKMMEFISQIENNNINDIHKELYLYIDNIKINFEKKIKDNIILSLCNFILNDTELYHINEPKLIIEKLNKLMLLI